MNYAVYYYPVMIYLTKIQCCLVDSYYAIYNSTANDNHITVI